MVDNNSKLEDALFSVVVDALVHCKDCVEWRKLESKVCPYVYPKLLFPEPNFFCKYGVRKKGLEKKINQKEKLDAMNRYRALKDLKFYRNLNGKVYLRGAC